MGRQWILFGPDRPDLDRYSLNQAAELLGYQDAESVRELVREGRLPRPRGIGAAQYYSGLDVAIILEMFGRWMPLERSSRAGEAAAKGGKSRENTDQKESQG